MIVKIDQMSIAGAFAKNNHVKIFYKKSTDTYTIKVKRNLNWVERIFRFFDNLSGSQFRKIAKVLNTPEGQAAIAGANPEQLNNLAKTNRIIRKLRKSCCVSKIAYINLPGVHAAPSDTKPNELLVDFYRGNGKDIEGRTLQNLWDLSLENKESYHNYIQWLFPNKVASAFNGRAPALTDALIQEMKTDEIKANLRISLNHMLVFYGLKWDNDKIVKADTFAERSKVWFKAGDHNHLRLTRILKCLDIFELKDEKTALFNCLKALKEESPDKVAPTTWTFWEKEAPTT